MTKTKEELPAALSFVKEIIEGKLEMKLSEDKTRRTDFKRGFIWEIIILQINLPL